MSILQVNLLSPHPLSCAPTIKKIDHSSCIKKLQLLVSKLFSNQERILFQSSSNLLKPNVISCFHTHAHIPLLEAHPLSVTTLNAQSDDELYEILFVTVASTALSSRDASDEQAYFQLLMRIVNVTQDVNRAARHLTKICQLYSHQDSSLLERTIKVTRNMTNPGEQQLRFNKLSQVCFNIKDLDLSLFLAQELTDPDDLSARLEAISLEQLSPFEQSLNKEEIPIPNEPIQCLKFQNELQQAITLENNIEKSQRLHRLFLAYRFYPYAVHAAMNNPDPEMKSTGLKSIFDLYLTRGNYEKAFIVAINIPDPKIKNAALIQLFEYYLERNEIAKATTVALQLSDSTTICKERVKQINMFCKKKLCAAFIAAQKIPILQIKDPILKKIFEIWQKFGRLDLAHAIALQISDSRIKSRCLETLCIRYQGLRNLEAAFAIAQQIPSSRKKSEILLSICNSYQTEHNPSQAAVVLQQALLTENEQTSLAYKSENLEQISILYEQLHDLRNAFAVAMTIPHSETRSIRLTKLILSLCHKKQYPQLPPSLLQEALIAIEPSTMVNTSPFYNPENLKSISIFYENLHDFKSAFVIAMKIPALEIRIIRLTQLLLSIYRNRSYSELSVSIAQATLIATKEITETSDSKIRLKIAMFRSIRDYFLSCNEEETVNSINREIIRLKT